MPNRPARLVSLNLNSEGSPQGYTSQHEYSFVEVDVHELYLISVIQYMTDI
jgi:hypothetical protein